MPHPAGLGVFLSLAPSVPGFLTGLHAVLAGKGCVVPGGHRWSSEAGFFFLFFKHRKERKHLAYLLVSEFPERARGYVGLIVPVC